MNNSSLESATLLSASFPSLIKNCYEVIKLFMYPLFQLQKQATDLHDIKCAHYATGGNPNFIHSESNLKSDKDGILHLELLSLWALSVI
jgi:hypothetical protein